MTFGHREKCTQSQQSRRLFAMEHMMLDQEAGHDEPSCTSIVQIAKGSPAQNGRGLQDLEPQGQSPEDQERCFATCYKQSLSDKRISEPILSQ